MHCETNTYSTAYDRFIILLNNNSVTSQHFHDDQIAIVELLENLQLCSCIVPFKSKLTVRCKSRFLTRLVILDSWTNRESRIKNNLSRIESTIESCRTKNKRFTHHWFLDNYFTKTYGCNTTQHGYTCISDSQKRLLLETRPIRVIKGMFLQGHLYHALFPQVKFQMPAPSANKQCILVYKQQHVYFVMSNDCGLIRLLGLIKISCNRHICP